MKIKNNEAFDLLTSVFAVVYEARDQIPKLREIVSKGRTVIENAGKYAPANLIAKVEQTNRIHAVALDLLTNEGKEHAVWMTALIHEAIEIEK